jgi:transposase InsO family protein
VSFGQHASRGAKSSRGVAQSRTLRGRLLSCPLTTPPPCPGVATTPRTQAGGGKLYVCAIKEVFSNRVVGYSIDSRMKSRLAVAALHNAVAMRAAAGVDVAGCIVHSDRGSQFRSREFLRALARHQLVGSMGKVGAAGDNAAMESFFSVLQKNVFYRRT